jgi:hypothetical protein
MGNEVHFFRPDSRRVGFWCAFIFLGIILNVRYLLGSGSVILYASLILLVGMFVFLFMPFLKNQKLIVSGKDIKLFTFGRINSLVFCKHLKEIVVKQDEIVSYRFENDGKYYQVSPGAYYDSEELKLLFNDLNRNCKGIVSIVQR